MVKFIASDMDGTLLDGDKQMPEGVFGLIEELYSNGILFAPASGRQYHNLRKLFYPVKDKVVFICENGALVKYREEILLSCPVGEEFLKGALDEIRALPHLFPILCGETTAYIENTDMPFYKYATDSYTSCMTVENLDAVIGREPVCKISVFDELTAEKNCIRVLPQRLPGLRTAISGKDWCDVSSAEADKGRAIRVIRDYFSLKKEECVAFGDHMNDYEMLTECGMPYVTENGFPPLKKLIGHTVPANTEGGVIQKIKEILAREK